jgi:threonine/homoserine/homoserine lactone efflux protein
MMPFQTWLLFCAACAALVATPGPNVLYLVSRTIGQGRDAGFVSLLGTTCGSGLHVVAAAFGLSALLMAVPLAYDAMRCAGALYLAWLAYSTWRSPDDAAPGAPPRPVPSARLFRDGFLTGVLNPKVAAFELAFFPQFLAPARGDVFAQSLVLGATQLAIALSGDSVYVLAASSVGASVWRSVAGRAAWRRRSKRGLAAVFALLALRLAWDDRGAAR